MFRSMRGFEAEVSVGFMCMGEWSLKNRAVYMPCTVEQEKLN